MEMACVGLKQRPKKASVPSTVTWPLVTVIVPENAVLDPVNVSVPLPTFVKLPLPVSKPA
jgi:hypothetical protein